MSVKGAFSYQKDTFADGKGPYRLGYRLGQRRCLFSCQKGAFAGGRGAVSALKGAVMSRNDAFLCKKGASAGERGAVSAQNGTVMCEKSTFSCQKGAFTGEGTPYLLRGHLYVRKGVFSCQKGGSADGRGAVSALNDTIVGEKGAFLYHKGAFTGEKALI